MDALIDRDILFGNPERTQTRISPDGAWLSWLAPIDGVTNVFIAPAATPADSRAITADSTRDIRMHSWSKSSARVLYLQDAGGDENWHLFSVNPHTGEVIDLTPGDAIHAQLLAASADHPDHIVIGINERNPQIHDWFRINVNTGERELLYENPGFVGGIFDHQLRPRLALAMQPDGAVLVLRIDGDAPAPLFDIPAEDNLTTSPIGFDQSGKILYMIDSRGRDTGALVALHLDDDTSEVLFEDPKADLADAWEHPITGTIQAAVSNYQRKTIVVLDPSIQPDIDRLLAWCDGELDLVSRTADDSVWLVAYSRDAGALRYARYTRSTGAIEHLWDHRPELAEVPLTAMHPQIITARDGLELVSYLSLPRWMDVDGRPSEALPMVLLVHGGPWARDPWGLSAEHQLLANRGYAVLSVNFRGSTGFGKSFINAANHQWAGTMHDDLLDAVKWAVDQGIALPNKVAIMGGSYGGYATLVGLAFTPEVFACGVDIVGPSNLLTLLETIPPYWKPLIAQFHARMGEADTPEGKKALWARSPLSKVDNIVRPLLIGQGANDPRVKQSESDQIVSAMAEHGIPVTYVLFPDEGHGFARKDNRLAFYAITEGFLAEHLGGRAQDAGDQIERSTAVVKNV